jgi:hypothetical protein
MSANLSMILLCSGEFVLTVALGLLFWKKGYHRRFHAMARYLALRVVSVPVLFLLLTGYLQFGIRNCYAAYFFVYWGVYIASAVLLFFVCLEIFRFALMPFPGLQRLGSLAFRWAVVVSLILTFATISAVHPAILTVADVASRLMRAASILELCLLTFLCICMNALKLSARDMSFGSAIGLGLMATNDFLQAASERHIISLVQNWQFMSEFVTLAVLGLWCVYALLPQRERKLVLLEASSPIYRWDEIASALGHTGTKVAVQQPANSFFLTDVEKVVERVVARNLKGRESET